MENCVYIRHKETNHKDVTFRLHQCGEVSVTLQGGHCEKILLQLERGKKTSEETFVIFTFLK